MRQKQKQQKKKAQRMSSKPSNHGYEHQFMGRTMGENADLDMDFAHHVKAILVSSRVKVPAPS